MTRGEDDTRVESRLKGNAGKIALTVLILPLCFYLLLPDSTCSFILFLTLCSYSDVIGVADGVGGWRQYGVDPGLFSSNLMKSCERLVHTGFFYGNLPSKLLEQVGTGMLDPMITASVKLESCQIA